MCAVKGPLFQQVKVLRSVMMVALGRRHADFIRHSSFRM